MDNVPRRGDSLLQHISLPTLSIMSPSPIPNNSPHLLSLQISFSDHMIFHITNQQSRLTFFILRVDQALRMIELSLLKRPILMPLLS